jgi:predicted dehydrogenase
MSGARAPRQGAAAPIRKALIADFADAVATGREPRISGREALKVHALVDSLLRSAAERRPVALA